MSYHFFLEAADETQTAIERKKVNRHNSLLCNNWMYILLFIVFFIATAYLWNNSHLEYIDNSIQ